MNIKSLASNLSIAFLAQGVSLVLSITMSLLVPKVLGVDEFGYWQLFLFYTSYVGFFHFGLNDGVYLLNGGRVRCELDKRSVNSQFWFGAAFQCVFAGIILSSSLGGGFGDQRGFVLAVTALFLVLNNASGYLGYVFQAINETKLFSFSIIIDKLVFLAPLCLLLATDVTDFRWYVAAYALSKLCSLVYCAMRAKDILASGFLGLHDTAYESAKSVGVGIKLMLANIAGMLVLGIVRFVVDAVWGIEIFGQLSFALSMVSFFMVFISQASMVLFPALRQSEEHELSRYFSVSRDWLSLLLPAVYILYFPAKWLLCLWLPQYGASLSLFALLLPLCLFDGKMSLVGTTFFKVLRMEGSLLIVNMITMAFSTIGACLGAFVFHSVEAVILSAVVAIIGRCSVSELLVGHHVGATWSPLGLGEIILTVIFLFVVITADDQIAWAEVIVAYLLYLLLFRKNAMTLFAKLRRLKVGGQK